MTATDILLHWAYVAVMAISAIVVLLMSRNPKGVPQYKYLIHVFVLVWSGLVYSAIALGQGQTEVAGQTVYFARYLDWVVSTPLLLLSLVLTGQYTVNVRGPIVAGMMGSQVIMILTGLLADLSPTDTARWFWYIAGCVALAVVLRMFWGPLYAKAAGQHPEIERVYKSSATFLTVQWLLYPTVWALGTPGIDLLSPMLTTVLLIILPIVSKAGFAFFNLGKLRALPDHLHPKEEPLTTADKFLRT